MDDLLYDAEYARIEAAITQNRIWAAELYAKLRAGEDAGGRLNRCNDAWYGLETEKAELTGIDFAPYKMR